MKMDGDCHSNSSMLQGKYLKKTFMLEGKLTEHPWNKLIPVLKLMPLQTFAHSK
jgi:hypothetical protein